MELSKDIPTVVIKHTDNGFEICSSSYTDIQVVIVEEDLCGDSNMMINGTEHIGFVSRSTHNDDEVEELIETLDV
jgi:hypothetical protein